MIMAADLFCGAGGSSTGLVRAAEARGLELQLLAVNHWRVAVDTHTRNHPWARHLCADLSTVDPSKAIPGGRLDLLIASPECTHHSVARGGKPCSDQSRASAWHVLHWVERLRVERVLLENVREFEGWGPLDDTGRPDKARKGETFGLCQPFVTKYYGTGVAHPVTEPLDTITSKDRFALVEPTRMDIYFRMLKPHELAAAMGFDGYEFAGTKTDQVRQIGNAVAVRTAQALCGAIMDEAV